MRKRLLSLLLTLALLGAVLPTSVLSARAVDGYAGTCGEKLTWRFNPDTGTLTFVGSGEMYDFTWFERPWSSCMTNIRQVILPDELTSIGSFAFYGCTGITTLHLPAGLATVGEAAFSGCMSLTAFSVAENNPYYCNDACGVVFNKAKTELLYYPCGRAGAYAVPEGVTSIGDDAFEGCAGLTAITFPEGLASIGLEAFTDCTGLTSLTLPAALTTVQYSSFYGCTGLTSISLPKGLTTIEYAAFSGCTSLTSITLPDGLTTIYDNAFFDCTALTSIVIPASVSEIKWDVFGYWWDPEREVYERVPNFKIYGYAGTAAETYAQENSFPFIPLDPTSGFADVDSGKYYYEPMLWALKQGVTGGTSPVSFSPNDTCTRAQVMTFLWKAKQSPEADWDSNPFVDVPGDKYYCKPVLWAVQNGVTGGADPTHFNPKGGCTRAQVVTFLWAASGKPEPTGAENRFVDVPESKYYCKAVLWAAERGITGGTDPTHFSPNKTCTRAQVVTFLHKLLAVK